MHKIFVKLFIKDYQNTQDMHVRAAYGTLAGIVGIISNIILATLKVIVGLFAMSSSMVADGVNNFSDSLTSIITLVGFKLSAKKPDKDHPFGYQRLEYITGLITSFVILMIGFTLGKDAVKGIIDLIKGTAEPLNVDNKILIIGALVVSILMKCLQSIFYRGMAKDVNSDALIASSKDSLNDCITTFAVLISTLVFIFTKGKLNIDSIASLIVSIFIILSAIDLIKDTMDPLLGIIPTQEEIDEIASAIESYEGVYGIHDLVIHNYGPNRKFVTCHAEVSREVDVMISHDLMDRIEKEVGSKLDIELTLHLDPIETNDELTSEAKEVVHKIIHEIDENLKFHDFRIVRGTTHTNLIFDVVVPFEYHLSDEELKKEIANRVWKYQENWFTVIDIDKDYARATENKK